MVCEKCKEKKATLFYADECGARHALCAPCGTILNGISELCENNQTPAARYIPDKTLCSFSKIPSAVTPYILCEVGREAVCSSCGAHLNGIIDKGRFSCPDCYECFEKYLSLPQRQKNGEPTLRMPSSRRADIDRRRTLENLKADIKAAVENENYELAATLRDKVKKLECTV